MSNLMSSVRELGFELNERVDNQGLQLENWKEQVDEANQNANRGANELNKYANSLKSKGVRTVLCLIGLVLVLAFLVYLIFT